jgi:probable HAF family extracellular repeat protein
MRTRMRAVRSFTAALISVSALLGASAVATAQTLYTIKDLGVLPGTGNGCYGEAITDVGTVVGACTGGPFNELAFIEQNGVMSSLGKLPKGNYSDAHSINAFGVAVGEADTGDYRPRATMYRNGSVIQIDSSGVNHRGIYISDSGVIVGDYVKGFSDPWTAVIWKERPTQPGRFDRLTLPLYPGGDPKTNSSYATGANQSTQVVGYVSNSLFGQLGAFWNSDATHTLTVLQPLPGGWTSLAWGVNNLGQVVGETRPPSHSVATLWQNDAAHTPVELGVLPGDTDSTATVINDQGQVIGISISAAGTQRTFLWQNGQMSELSSLLDGSGTGWVIVEVYDINNQGQIVGAALNPLGQFRPFVMSPVVK